MRPPLCQQLIAGEGDFLVSLVGLEVLNLTGAVISPVLLLAHTTVSTGGTSITLVYLAAEEAAPGALNYNRCNSLLGAIFYMVPSNATLKTLKA